MKPGCNKFLMDSGERNIRSMKKLLVESLNFFPITVFDPSLFIVEGSVYAAGPETKYMQKKLERPSKIIISPERTSQKIVHQLFLLNGKLRIVSPYF